MWKGFHEIGEFAFECVVPTRRPFLCKFENVREVPGHKDFSVRVAFLYRLLR